MIRLGVHSDGQVPPKMPRASECTLRSFDRARIPSEDTVGGTTAVAPLAYAHRAGPDEVSNARAFTVRPGE